MVNIRLNLRVKLFRVHISGGIGKLGISGSSTIIYTILGDYTDEFNIFRM